MAAAVRRPADDGLLVPVIVLATLVAAVAYVGGAIWLGTHGMATLAEAMAGLLVAAEAVTVRPVEPPPVARLGLFGIIDFNQY